MAEPQPPQSSEESRAEDVLGGVRAIFRAVTTAVAPGATELDEAGWAEAEALVADTLRDRSQSEQRQLRFFLRFMKWAPVARYGRTFTSLTLPQRQRVLRYFQEHCIQLVRSGFWGLRTLAFLGYYGRPAKATAIGYKPEVRGWEAVR